MSMEIKLIAGPNVLKFKASIFHPISVLKHLMKYNIALHKYLDSLIDITLGAGVAFELPMATWLLSKLGIITPDFLRTYRKYAYIALLVVAAIITPSPDWGSQLIVVVPLVLLYEISILIAARVKKKQDKDWE